MRTSEGSGALTVQGRGRRSAALLLALLTGSLRFALAQESPSPAQLANMSLQQLSSLEVTSVSKAPEPLSQAPASIYVITHEAILRSGATTIAEALRLAPNLLVTQVTSSSFVVAARGLGGNAQEQNFSNKLLVLIDGRSVYSPLYSGVYLEVQDVSLDDVDRIEVISGPGATLWGANAMNGVINIITRPAYESQGALVDAGAGNQQQTATARYGANLNGETSLRVYAKTLRDGSESQPDGANAHDSWDKNQAGFRLDWSQGLSALTAEADAYRGLEHAGGQPGALVSGASALARWQYGSGPAQWQVQTDVDQSERGAAGGGDGFALQTYDASVQENLTIGTAHRVVWGAGYRINNYDITSRPDFRWIPGHRALTLGNVFGQDTFAITASLRVVGGVKFEDDPYSGWQVLPDVRAAFDLSPGTLLWVSASRAVRSPTPFDEDVLEYVPPVQLSGDHDFRPESVWDEELGLRATPVESLTLSGTFFHDRYSDLRTILLAPPAIPPIALPLTWGNTERSTTYGVEMWAQWRVTSWWEISPGFRAVHESFSFVPGVLELIGPFQAGDDPSVQATLATSLDLGRRFGLYAAWRYVGALPSPALPAYSELDARLVWHALPSLDIALKGTNLLQAHHLEAPLLGGGEYIDRAFMAQVTYRSAP
jgi:iron complex outermembrane recepter protein